MESAEEAKKLRGGGYSAHLRKAYPEKVIVVTSEPRLGGCVGVRQRSTGNSIPGEGNVTHVQRNGGVRVVFCAMLSSSIRNRGVAEDEACRSNSLFFSSKSSFQLKERTEHLMVRYFLETNKIVRGENNQTSDSIEKTSPLK